MLADGVRFGGRQRAQDECSRELEDVRAAQTGELAVRHGRLRWPIRASIAARRPARPSRRRPLTVRAAHRCAPRSRSVKVAEVGELDRFALDLGDGRGAARNVSRSGALTSPSVGQGKGRGAGFGIRSSVVGRRRRIASMAGGGRSTAATFERSRARRCTERRCARRPGMLPGRRPQRPSVTGDSDTHREGHRSVVLIQPIKRPEIAVRESIHRFPIGPVSIGSGHDSRGDLGIAHRSLRRTVAHGSIVARGELPGWRTPESVPTPEHVPVRARRQESRRPEQDARAVDPSRGGAG